MKEYIEREAAISSLDELEKTSRHNSVLWPDHVEECREVLRSLPAANVRPVVRGRWKNNHCSACGMMPMGEEIWECCDFAPPKFEWFMNFCPNCGARMEES